MRLITTFTVPSHRRIVHELIKPSTHQRISALYLVIQECKECDVKIFYPRKYCPECWSSDLGWSEASGKAKVYSFSILMDQVEPKFKEDLPYVLALVDLEEGIRMMTCIVDCEPEEVKMDMDVEVVFEDITDEFSLPYFRPIGG